MRHADAFAVIVMDGCKNVNIFGDGSAESVGGVAVVARDSSKISIDGISAKGAAGGVHLKNVSEVKLSLREAVCTGQPSQAYLDAQARDRLADELRHAPIPHSDRELLIARVNEVLDGDPLDPRQKDRCNEILERGSQYSTILSFTIEIFEKILKTLG